MTRRLLIQASSDSISWINAVGVKLSDEGLERLRGRRNIFAKLKTTDPALVEIAFVDDLVSSYLNLNLAELLSMKQLAIYQQSGWVEFSPISMFFDGYLAELKPERAECDMIVLDERGVMWRTYPKETNELVESEQVTYEELFGKEND